MCYKTRKGLWNSYKIFKLTTLSYSIIFLKVPQTSNPLSPFQPSTKTPHPFPSLPKKNHTRKNPLYMQVPNCSGYSFGFCWCRWRFNHGRLFYYAFESFNCTSRRGKTWRKTAWCECLPTVARWRTVPKSGSHLSRSFGIGSMIIS